MIAAVLAVSALFVTGRLLDDPDSAAAPAVAVDESDSDRPTRGSTPPASTGAQQSDEAGGAQVATPAPSQIDAERPRVLTLPSGTTMAVDAAATGAQGELVIPTDVDRAGWWDGSARVGDPFGSIVVAAHVDSFDEGLGRIAELLETRPGDRITLRSRDLRQEFRVVSAELVPKAALSRSSPWYDVAGDARLVLITCGGEYDPSSGGYQDNLVVEALPAGPLEDE